MRRDGVKELSWFYDNLRISTNAGPCCDRDVTGIGVGARIRSSFSSSLSAVKDAFEAQIGALVHLAGRGLVGCFFPFWF